MKVQLVMMLAAMIATTSVAHPKEKPSLSEFLEDGLEAAEIEEGKKEKKGKKKKKFDNTEEAVTALEVKIDASADAKGKKRKKRAYEGYARSLAKTLNTLSAEQQARVFK